MRYEELEQSIKLFSVRILKNKSQETNTNKFEYFLKKWGTSNIRKELKRLLILNSLQIIALI